VPVTTAFETHGLTRSFHGQIALDDLDLTAERGEVLALLGPNGAGKTTTVRLLNGILRPDAGSSRVLGLDPLADGDELRRRTGVLTEHAGLDERLSARENLRLTARIRGLPADVAARRIGELLERFGMSERADEPMGGFSTGQRKRVGLVRALLHEPELLFLDEPTSGLDPEATRDVVELIASLAADHGRTVVLCTHFLAEAGRLAHRMAVLDRGRLQAFGRPAELAAELQPDIDALLELGGPAGDDVLGALRATPGVLAAEATPAGAHVRVADRSVVPQVIAALVAREVPVYAAVPHEPTLEDVYFALQERRRAGSPAAGGGPV
jgi:ABC-2 type transport system ATP-binding protein